MSDLKEVKAGRTQTPARYRAAKSSATVGAIEAEIAKTYGLPAGSVCLRKPGKEDIRSDATIATLRAAWDAE